MKTTKRILPVMLTAGVALTAMSGAAIAAENPFAAQELTAGYQLAESGFKKEGNCGEGKCGANAADKVKSEAAGEAKPGFKAEGKCGEAQCGANAADKVKTEAAGDAKPGFKAEGTCGEGKCGANKNK